MIINLLLEQYNVPLINTGQPTLYTVIQYQYTLPSCMRSVLSKPLSRTCLSTPSPPLEWTAGLGALDRHPHLDAALIQLPMAPYFPPLLLRLRVVQWSARCGDAPPRSTSHTYFHPAFHHQK